MKLKNDIFLNDSFCIRICLIKIISFAWITACYVKFQHCQFNY